VIRRVVQVDRFSGTHADVMLECGHIHLEVDNRLLAKNSRPMLDCQTCDDLAIQELRHAQLPLASRVTGA